MEELDSIVKIAEYALVAYEECGTQKVSVCVRRDGLIVRYPASNAAETFDRIMAHIGDDTEIWVVSR